MFTNECAPSAMDRAALLAAVRARDPARKYIHTQEAAYGGKVPLKKASEAQLREVLARMDEAAAKGEGARSLGPS